MEIKKTTLPLKAQNLQFPLDVGILILVYKPQLSIRNSEMETKSVWNGGWNL